MDKLKRQLHPTGTIRIQWLRKTTREKEMTMLLVDNKNEIESTKLNCQLSAVCVHVSGWRSSVKLIQSHKNTTFVKS